MITNLARSGLGRLAALALGAGLLSGLAVSPALAATGLATGATAAAARVDATEDLHRTRCADAWLTAAANPTVEVWQAVGTCEIDRRLGTIERLRRAVDDARALTDDHAAALTRILDGSESGLRALRAEIEADATVADLHHDIRRIFSEFRIYALVTRQAFLVIAADAETAAGHALDGTADDLASLIARAEGAGKDVTEARAHLAAMRSAIDAAVHGVSGVADDVLPLTPADWNDGTAEPVLREARQAIADARGELKTAVAEARKVIAALG